MAVRKVETGAVEAGLELARSLRGIWKAEALARIARAVDDPLQSSLVPEVITASADEQAASWLARHLELIDDTESPVLGLAVALADQGKPEVALDVTRAVPMRHGDGRPASGVLTLSRLAPHLPQPLARQALRDAVEATRAVGDVPDRIRALVQLAESLSPDEQRALAPCFDRALGEIDNITDENQRVRALADILPHLTPPQLERALELARKAARADLEVRLLTAVAPFLESPARDRVVAEADELAVNVRWGQTNSSTLARLISLLNLDRQRQWIEEVKQGELRGFVSGVCSSVSSELVPELLQVVLDSDDGPIRQQGLTGLAPRLGPRDAQRALAAIIELPETNGARVDALAAIAPALPSSSLDTALEAIRDLDREENEYSYGNASGALAHRLASDGRIDEALQLVAFIVDKDDWAQAVIDVTQTIPQSDRADLMRGTIAQFELAEDPVVIAILTAALPEPERGESAVRVFEASRTAEDPDQQARLVELAAPWLPPEYLGEAVELVRTLDTMGYIYQRSRAKALRSLAPRLASLEPATFYDAMPNDTPRFRDAGARRGALGPPGARSRLRGNGRSGPDQGRRARDRHRDQVVALIRWRSSRPQPRRHERRMGVSCPRNAMRAARSCGTSVLGPRAGRVRAPTAAANVAYCRPEVLGEHQLGTVETRECGLRAHVSARLTVRAALSAARVIPDDGRPRL